jgi:hypothetical protein
VGPAALNAFAAKLYYSIVIGGRGVGRTSASRVTDCAVTPA